jgi:prepilin-type N-terminal cleavage/methylation domain-containing protein
VRQTKSNISGRRASGFSLVEMLIVIVIMGIMAAMAMYSIVGALPNIKVNNGLNTAMGLIKNGKYLATSQRRNYQLMFLAPTQLWLRRLEVPAGFTDQPVVALPGGVQFLLFPGMPDTPDGFGNCGAICFGGTLTQSFLSNGEFVDSAGAPLNGTVYLGIPGNPATQRAITITGTTGRLRAYRWTGAAWLEY